MKEQPTANLRPIEMDEDARSKLLAGFSDENIDHMVESLGPHDEMVASERETTNDEE